MYFMKFLEKYTLEITLFFSGATVMIFEILWSRVYWPFMWTSTFVWTSLIGVILWFISLGYYIGWKKADKHASEENIANILFAAAIGMFFVFLIKDPILSFFQNLLISLEISTILSAIILFWPVSFFLGLISPFAVKLKIKNLSRSWEIVGRMYAIGTLGSIIGTFAAWFVLIPLIWTNTLLLCLIFALIVLSLFVSRKSYFILRILFAGFFVIAIFLSSYSRQVNAENGYVDLDTKYSRVQIFDSVHLKTGKDIKVFQINAENHSAIFLDSDELVFEYTKYYHLVNLFNPNFKKTLMLWWGWYSFPKEYLKAYPEKFIDVVEIDDGVTKLAKKYFGLRENDRMNIYHRDAREFLNTTEKKYDAIFSDAFWSYYSIPYQLTTQEAVQKKYDILNDKGVVLSNIISWIEGDNGKFFRAEYATYKSVFPQVYVFPVDEFYDGKKVRNIMLIASKNEEKIDFSRVDPNLQQYLNNIWKKQIQNDMPVLRDDFAPVNSYIADML